MLNHMPQIEYRSGVTSNYTASDINSYLIANNVILIDGEINLQNGEILTLIFTSFLSKEPCQISIILQNVKCYETRLMFSYYGYLQELRKLGFDITLQLNGVVSELAVLFAFMKFDEKIFQKNSMILINEFKTDYTFPPEETQHLQASDLQKHLEFYIELEARYFNLLSQESGFDVERIRKMHDRQNFLSYDNLIELGFNEIGAVNKREGE